MKVIFMGTPDFAVGALQAIIDAGHEVLLVVTQPDREKAEARKFSSLRLRNVLLSQELKYSSRLRLRHQKQWQNLRNMMRISS